MTPDFTSLTPSDISSLTDAQLQSLAAEILHLQREDRQQNQIRYYKPVSARCYRVHQSTARLLGVSGGNGSSKTESNLVDMIALATGHFPLSIAADLRPRFRGPVNQRIVVESLTTTLHPIILPKLKHWVWTGVGEQGGDKGHWGWVPKDCLQKGEWDKSWSEKLRMLTLRCYDPDDGHYLGNSTIQFMSHDQDPSDFASGDFHDILHDEPPREAIFVENEARTMRVNGRVRLAMTWPDNPAIPVDWIFERVFDPAHEGDNPDIEWIELYTTENAHLNQEAIAAQMRRWSETERQVRIYGRPVRFSNLIHPDFTDRESHWCFSCKRQVVPDPDDIELCVTCDNRTVVPFCHVMDFVHNPSWPVVHLLDPHPRKPHMWLWVAVDPSDDLWVLDEGESTDELPDITQAVEKTEREERYRVVKRLMDPNMGASPVTHRRTYADGSQITWQSEFRHAGLAFGLANDSDVGRMRLNEYLKPDSAREQPRIHIHPRCVNTIRQIKRYAWDEHKKRDERDIKQKARDKHDDYPTLLKYLMNSYPTFHMLTVGPEIIRAGGRGKRGY